MGAPRTRVCGNCKWNNRGVCYALPPSFSGGFQARPLMEATDYCSLFEKESKPKPKKDGPTANDIVSLYSSLYYKKYNQRPIVDGKDRAVASSLLRSMDYKDLKIYISEFVNNPPRWNVEKGLLSISMLPSYIKNTQNKNIREKSRYKKFGVAEAMEFISDQGVDDLEYKQYILSTFRKITYEDWKNEQNI